MRTGEKKLDLSIIMVNWNVKSYLKQCLLSLFENIQDLSYEIIVVDNNSVDGSVELIEREFPQIHLIQNKVNLGFAKANNQGMNLCRGRYILLLNPDTYVTEKAIDKMVEFMDNHKGIGVVGPVLLYPDGSFQYIHYSFPTPFSEILNILNLEKLIYGRFLKSKLEYFVKSGHPKEVDWVSGSCLLVRSSVVKDVGGIDEHFFLFSEDLDWCYRIKVKGWKIYQLSSAKVVHFGGRSSIQNVFNMLISRYHGRYLFLKTHYSWLKKTAFRLITIFGLIVILSIRSTSLLIVTVFKKNSRFLRFFGKPEEIKKRIKAYCALLHILIKPRIAESNFLSHLKKNEMVTLYS